MAERFRRNRGIVERSRSVSSLISFKLFCHFSKDQVATYSSSDKFDLRDEQSTNMNKKNFDLKKKKKRRSRSLRTFPSNRRCRIRPRQPRSEQANFSQNFVNCEDLCVLVGRRTKKEFCFDLNNGYLVNAYVHGK